MLHASLFMKRSCKGFDMKKLDKEEEKCEMMKMAPGLSTFNPVSFIAYG